jgi:hypothetical protein
MGFLYNIDVMAAEGRYPSASTVARVTGTFGWPEVPGDVKLAAVWTIQDWISKPKGDNQTSEAISGYSRSWGRSGELPTALAIPNRARDILAQYQKQHV